MLDDLYGLLEPDESAGLAAHVATCPACATVYEKAKADQHTLQTASTLSFPALTFTPPADAPVVPSEYAGPREKSVRSAWLGWAVAAGLLLAASGTLGPAVRQVATYVALSNDLASARSAVTAAEVDYREKKAAFDGQLAEATKPVDAARAAHDKLVTEWVSAETAAASARPFAVTVRGPAVALPGAPNVYAIAAVNDAEVAVAAKITASASPWDNCATVAGAPPLLEKQRGITSPEGSGTYRQLGDRTASVMANLSRCAVSCPNVRRKGRMKPYLRESLPKRATRCSALPVPGKGGNIGMRLSAGK
jgi:hypothetical protein